MTNQDIENLLKELDHIDVTRNVIRARNLTLIGENHHSPRHNEVIKEIPTNKRLVVELPVDYQTQIDNYCGVYALSNLLKRNKIEISRFYSSFSICPVIINLRVS